MNLIDRGFNKSFDYLLKYMEEKRKEEKRKETIRFIFSI